MSERLGEDHQIFSEQITLSSVSSGLTHGYSMEDCDQISFICGMGTALADSTTIKATLVVRQSGDLSLSTSTTVGGATAVLGPSTAEQINNARSVLITFGTAATGAQTVTLNGHTLTYSTSTAAWSTVATALTFGSTQGSTVAEGLELSANSFSSVVNNSTLNFWVTASTPSTASVRLTAKDTASTGITILGISAAYGITSERSHSQIDIRAADLNSTSKFVGLAISNGSTVVNQIGVTVIKSGLRHSPPYQAGQAYKKST